MLRHLLSRSPVALAAVFAAIAVTPAAFGDQVYHSEHLALTPVGSAPLRSGFVENIHPNGPNVFAHEIYALNGAERNTTYQVTLFIFSSTTCEAGTLLAAIETAQIQTNGSGNGVNDFFISPDAIGGLHGATIGVRWTMTSTTSSYETRCTTVTLD
jgi:hypothetical protein